MKSFEEYWVDQQQQAFEKELELYHKRCHRCRTREERKLFIRTIVYVGLFCVAMATLVLWVLERLA